MSTAAEHPPISIASLMLGMMLALACCIAARVSL
jgi:hypothetical protein